VEGFLAEQRIGVERIVKWVGEASTTQEPLGLSPIQVAEAPSSIGSVLQRLESTLIARPSVCSTWSPLSSRASRLKDGSSLGWW
jgi:hypothetical protein